MCYVRSMEKHGKLTILDLKNRKNRKVLCRCDCGNEKWINIDNVRSGATSSCGCIKRERMREEAKKRFTKQKPANYKDFTGKKIGTIEVLRRVKDRRKHTTTYLCRCGCGTEFEQEVSNLRRCKYKICDHIYPKHPLRMVLSGMVQRCENSKEKAYRYYGAKGITVCEKWKTYPHTFIEWALANGWKDGLQIDRIISTGNYEEDNCRFVLPTDNSKRAMRKRWTPSENSIYEAKEYLEKHGYTVEK